MSCMTPFKEEEMTVDESLGYPKAYARLCRSSNVLMPYGKGPPSVFLPYTLQPQEALKVKDLNHMFPVIDQDSSHSINPRGYVNLLWKQLDHLGNAGFDHALFRVDPYGNVLYLHADSASPLAWDIDHWFPCSRGGKTVPSNLRLLQWQACKRKQNKLEFLVPWWDLQVGITVNQFLLVFASRNSDFRKRAFSFLFLDGSKEELSLQTTDSHTFPRHFIDMKRHLGLAPAAVVSSQKGLDASVLNAVDINKNMKPISTLIASKKLSNEEDDALSMTVQRFNPSDLKENDNPTMDSYNTNPYFSISMAMDSMRHREENKKKQYEIIQLAGELDNLKQNNEHERMALQELEALLVKKRRRVEKCRRLAETQASYRAVLEKMIRDAMHQAVVYKEQIRLNQAATNALMARLDAQRELCASSEKELHKRIKQKDEIEKQVRPCSEHARKKLRSDGTLFEEKHDKIMLSKTTTPLRKELRLFLEEEHKASEAGSFLVSEEEESAEDEGSLNSNNGDRGENSKAVIVSENDLTNTDHRLMGSAIVYGQLKNTNKTKNSSCIEGSLAELEQFRSMFNFKDVEDRDHKHKQLANGEGLCSSSGGEPGKNKLHRVVHGEEQRSMLIAKDETSPSKKPEELESRETWCTRTNKLKKNLPPQSLYEEDEEQRNQIGKKNIDKWLKLMLEDAHKGSTEELPSGKPKKQENCKDKTASNLNILMHSRLKPLEEKVDSYQKHDDEQIDVRDCNVDRNNKFIESSGIKMLDKSSQTRGAGSSGHGKGFGGRKSFEGKEREKKVGGIVKCESARGFRSFPSSPSMILSIRKGVDCMGRKPKVTGDEIDDKDELEHSVATNNKFIKTSARTSKETVKK